MPFASGSGTRIAFVPEATFGTTPAMPVFQIARFTGAGFRTNKTTGTSDEIRADRNVPDEFLLGKDAAGDYDFELSYGTFDGLLEGLMFSTWSADVLKNGIAPKYFTFEETLELGATDSFSRFTGCMVNTMRLEIAARQAVTGSFGILGKRETLATAIVAGATYTAATNTPVLTASAHVSTLTVAGSSYSVRRVSLEVNNNLRTRPVVGDEYSVEFGHGRFDVSGTIEVYFESNALYQSVLDHGGGSIVVEIGAATGEKYMIRVPNAKFGNGERSARRNDSDVMLNIPFRGLYHTGNACTMDITRARP